MIHFVSLVWFGVGLYLLATFDVCLLATSRSNRDRWLIVGALFLAAVLLCVVLAPGG